MTYITENMKINREVYGFPFGFLLVFLSVKLLGYGSITLSPFQVAQVSLSVTVSFYHRSFPPDFSLLLKITISIGYFGESSS